LHETTYRLGVGIIGYSPLCFGLLTGKYDNDQATSPWNVDQGRMSHVNPNYLENRRRYWASESTFSASFKYNQLAKKHGLTPTQLALGYCKQSWYISSTLIGTTNLTQLEENIRSYDTDLDQNILDQINKIHQEIKDPAF
jgi:aryl-alcohol dehydrogenase-like predicted oxidoreductase